MTFQKAHCEPQNINPERPTPGKILVKLLHFKEKGGKNLNPLCI